jgi:hypothetical protein
MIEERSISNKDEKTTHRAETAFEFLALADIEKSTYPAANGQTLNAARTDKRPSFDQEFLG